MQLGVRQWATSNESTQDARMLLALPSKINVDGPAKLLQKVMFS
jgi:hypothetical protein